MARPHKRTPCVALFLMVAACCLVAALALSARFQFGLTTRHCTLFVCAGHVGYEHALVTGLGPNFHTLGPLFVGPLDMRIQWWFYPGPYSADTFSVPLWIPAVVLGALAFLLVHRSRRRPNHCPHCRYNLTGLPPNSPCPECGNASRREARS